MPETPNQEMQHLLSGLPPRYNNCLHYLAAPYSHPDPEVRAARLAAITAAAAAQINAGVTIFSPLTYTRLLTEAGAAPKSWYDFDLQFLAKSDRLAILTLPGWEQSSGIILEAGFAQARGLPIYHLDWHANCPGLTPEQSAAIERGLALY